MRKMIPALCILALFLGFGRISPILAGDDSSSLGKGIQIEGNEIVLRPDGTLEASGGLWVRGGVGSDFEFARSERSGSVRSSPHLAPHDQGTSLLAHTELKPHEGILFHLEWREGGKLVRTEEAVSRDFAPVTRTFMVEPESGLKHVVRFTPVMEVEGASPPAQQQVDRMSLDPGLIRGPFLRDGKMLAMIPGFGPGFEKIYVNIPRAGFFQFSLHPFPGGDPSGRLEGAVLSFEWRGEEYQWFLGRSPLPERIWTVFVKATEGIPAEWRDAIKPEFSDGILVGGWRGAP